MNILFVCKAGLNRSRTFEIFFSHHDRLNKYKSCGVFDNNVMPLSKINNRLIGWAHKIILLDKSLEKNPTIQKAKAIVGHNIMLYHIDDIYNFYDEQLLQFAYELKKKLGITAFVVEGIEEYKRDYGDNEKVKAYLAFEKNIKSSTLNQLGCIRILQRENHAIARMLFWDWLDQKINEIETQRKPLIKYTNKVVWSDAETIDLIIKKHLSK